MIATSLRFLILQKTETDQSIETETDQSIEMQRLKPSS